MKWNEKKITGVSASSMKWSPEMASIRRRAPRPRNEMKLKEKKKYQSKVSADNQRKKKKSMSVSIEAIILPSWNEAVNRRKYIFIEATTLLEKKMKKSHNENATATQIITSK